MGRIDLDHLEQHLIEARDALIAYWEQPEGQVCLLAVRIAGNALTDWRVLDHRALQAGDPEGWRRIAALADEVTRLYAPLDGMT